MLTHPNPPSLSLSYQFTNTTILFHSWFDPVFVLYQPLSDPKFQTLPYIIQNNLALFWRLRSAPLDLNTIVLLFMIDMIDMFTGNVDCSTMDTGNELNTEN